MQENFEDALKAVLVHEGGFVTRPDDPGGATNRGVTLTVFQRHFPGADVDALRGITDGQVANIYHVDYWSACRCDELAAGIDYAFFDQAMNSGPSRSIRWLQQAVDAGMDGVIGPETIRLANAASVAVERMCDERLSFMQAQRGGRLPAAGAPGHAHSQNLHGRIFPRLARMSPQIYPMRFVSGPSDRVEENCRSRVKEVVVDGFRLSIVPPLPHALTPAVRSLLRRRRSTTARRRFVMGARPPPAARRQ